MVTQCALTFPMNRTPDYEMWHGRHGEIISTLTDHAGSDTGDERDNLQYRVRFEDGSTMDFRWRDLRPPIED